MEPVEIRRRQLRTPRTQHWKPSVTLYKVTGKIDGIRFTSWVRVNQYGTIIDSGERIGAFIDYAEIKLKKFSLIAGVMGWRSEVLSRRLPAPQAERGWLTLRRRQSRASDRGA